MATAPSDELASRRRAVVTVGAAVAPDLDFAWRLLDGVNHHQAQGHSIGVGLGLAVAVMQWIDVPIVLYTRAPITSQREARTVHGADDFVSKQDGPEPVLARVVTQFRRG